MPDVTKASSQKYLWIALGVIVILVAAYFWYSRQYGSYERENPAASNQEASIKTPTDDVQSIESDLGATDLNNLDTDVAGLEAELSK